MMRQTLFTSPRPDAVLVSALLALALALASLAPPAAAQSACDCSCDTYATMMEQARAAAESGDYSGMMQMSRCAGQCAAAWGQCDGSASASTREEERDPGLPKEQLTPAYLEGMWCSVYGGQETTQYRFDGQGNYEIGVPAGRGYAMQGNFRSLEEFRDGFDRLLEREADGFTTEHLSGRHGRHSRKSVYTRGPCPTGGFRPQ